MHLSLDRLDWPMFQALRTILLSACLMAVGLLLPGQQAAAGFLPNTPFGSNTGNANSWVAGGHAGYNWQQGAAVYGFETDFQGSHLNSSQASNICCGRT
jgi:opacity protein-like surface antigen